MSGEGYIETREREGQTFYFAQLDLPHLWYGPERPTKEQAINDGREHCRNLDIYVPCFETAEVRAEKLRRYQEKIFGA